MKKGDFQTWGKAQKYYKTRFAGGLSLVHKDEVLLLHRWIERVNKPKLAFLDLGSGTGRIARELLEHSPETVYALDSSPAMLNYLKGLYSAEVKDGKLRLLSAQANKIPMLEESTDFITAFHLFKHLPNIKPTLKEANRVLKKAGYLMFEALNSNSIVRFNLGSCFALSEGELKKLLADAGFVVKETAFLHNIGETPYKLAGPLAPLVHLVDRAVSATGIKLGTKIFVLAQKG